MCHGVRDAPGQHGSNQQRDEADYEENDRGCDARLLWHPQGVNQFVQTHCQDSWFPPFAPPKKQDTMLIYADANRILPPQMPEKDVKKHVDCVRM